MSVSMFKHTDINILEWKGASHRDEMLAQKISKKLQLEDIYFIYNVPLQIWISYNEEENPRSGISLENSRILNYMPRREECKMESLAEVFKNGIEVTAKDIKDFMKISSLIVKNLARKMAKFDPLGKEPDICYPNCN